jgi:phospholipid/cholesterol/gamma-HCH transport system ATP-binding protein
MIEIESLFKRMDGGWVLRGVDLMVPTGSITAVVGPSGAGKSVLLRHVIGLLVPDRGDVRIDGRSITRARYVDLPEIRRRMGYVFQDAALLDSLTVRDNLRLAMDDAMCESEPESVPRRMAATLALVNLTEEVLDKLPGDLSGGMRKRVGVARAIINEPSVVLYDEPSTGLDPRNAALIHSIIARARDRLGATSLVVTHNVLALPLIADKVALLDEGRIMFQAGPDEFLRSQEPHVLAFLGRSGEIEEESKPWAATHAARAS